VLAATASAQAVSERAALVNGTPILTADVDAKLGTTWRRCRSRSSASVRSSSRRSSIRSCSKTRRQAGSSIAALVRSEILARVAAVTDEDVTRFYEENRAKLQGDRATLEGQIKTFLTAQRAEVRQKGVL
jgi:hypothetical protein